MRRRRSGSGGASATCPSEPSLDPNLPATVQEVVATGLVPALGLFGRVGAAERARIAEVLGQVGMAAQTGARIGTLSTGQQQRVLIARALVSNPELLILDEPTGGVDPEAQTSFYALLQHLNREREVTLILVSHDIGVVAKEVTKLACLNRRLVFHGPPGDFLSDAALDRALRPVRARRVAPALSCAMPEFLQYGFMHRAFAVGAITAVICPAIGVFLVPRRLSLIADTLAHVALAGVALGLLLGVSPILGALVVTLAGAVGMERMRARGALQGDAALAVFLSGGFAVAVVLISLARGFNADLFAILFGSILTVSPGDVWLIAALGAVVVGTVGTFYKQLLAITLNEDLARTSGVPVTGLNLLLTILTALTTVVAMRMVGVLLVSAMIVIPTLTGFALGRSFRKAAAIAIAMALVSVTLGLIAAYYLRLAAGGAIVLTALGVFALASLARRAAPRASREARS